MYSIIINLCWVIYIGSLSTNTFEFQVSDLAQFNNHSILGSVSEFSKILDLYIAMLSTNFPVLRPSLMQVMRLVDTAL